MINGITYYYLVTVKTDAQTKFQVSEEFKIVLKLASLSQPVFEDLIIVFRCYETFKLLDQKRSHNLKAKENMKYTYFKNILTVDEAQFQLLLRDLWMRKINIKVKFRKYNNHILNKQKSVATI